MGDESANRPPPLAERIRRLLDRLLGSTVRPQPVPVPIPGSRRPPRV